LPGRRLHPRVLHLFAVLLGNLILCKDRAPRLDRCRLALPEKQVVEHLILERVDKLIRRQTVRPRAVIRDRAGHY